jgi:hypothetical protein
MEDRDKRIQAKLVEAAKRAGIDEVYSLYNMKRDWWDVTVYFWGDRGILRGEYHMDSIVDDADTVITRCIMDAKAHEDARRV